MKRFFFLFCLLSTAWRLMAQDLTIGLTIEDKDGLTDSLTLIVTTTSMDSALYGQGIDDPNQFAFVLQSRQTEIWGKTACASKPWGEYKAFKIAVQSERYPIHICWNNSPLGNDSYGDSFLTDWREGGWFDAGGGEIINMCDNSSADLVYKADECQYMPMLNHDMGFFYVAIGTGNDVWDAVENVEAEIAPQKILRNSQVLILRNGRTYDLTGRITE